MTIYSQASRAPHARVFEARKLLDELQGDTLPMAVFASRFGGAVLDLALDDLRAELTVRAVAWCLALERAVELHMPRCELDFLQAACSEWCPHVQEGQIGTLDLAHRSVYCADCEDDFTPDWRGLGDGHCDVCVTRCEELIAITTAKAGWRVQASLCPSCAAFSTEAKP